MTSDESHGDEGKPEETVSILGVSDSGRTGMTAPPPSTDPPSYEDAVRLEAVRRDRRRHRDTDGAADGVDDDNEQQQEVVGVYANEPAEMESLRQELLHGDELDLEIAANMDPAAVRSRLSRRRWPLVRRSLLGTWTALGRHWSHWNKGFEDYLSRFGHPLFIKRLIYAMLGLFVLYILVATGVVPVEQRRVVYPGQNMSPPVQDADGIEWPPVEDG